MEQDSRHIEKNYFAGYKKRPQEAKIIEVTISLLTVTAAIVRVTTHIVVITIEVAHAMGKIAKAGNALMHITCYLLFSSHC